MQYYPVCRSAAPTAAAFLLAASTADAGILTWVSGKGQNIAGCGPIANPCRTFQYAHAVTAPGGVIAVADSGDYGSLTIRKSISVLNEGGAMALVQLTRGPTAITIDAGPTAKVVLRGLTLEGAGTGGSGIALNSAGYLSIEKCSVRNFTAAGVALVPTNTAKIVVSDTIIEGNGTYGLFLQPSVTGPNTKLSLNRVESYNNALHGIGVYGNFLNAATATGSANETISALNGEAGFYGAGKNAIPTSSAVLHLSRSMSTMNNAGVKLEEFAFGRGVSENYLLGNFQSWEVVNPSSSVTGLVSFYTFGDNVADGPPPRKSDNLKQ